MRLNKRIFLYAAAAAIMAACSSNDAIVEQMQQKQAQLVKADQEVAVGFEAYTQRGVTRAGMTGDLTTSTGVHNLQTDGFGVFGYYTDNNDYDQLSIPNFMYNQKVAWDNGGGLWKYEPVKYWPNEYGNSAISDDADRVTFFAYAPYVEVDPANGKVKKTNSDDDKWGIAQLSRNTASGDPIVKYIGSFAAAKSVDLCWGVCDENTWARIDDAQKQTFDFGTPWLNVERPETVDQKLKFTFKHALAKLQVNVDHFTDATDNTKDLDNKTRIFIRSVRFNGFAMKGALSLNNEEPNKPYWLNYNGIGDLEADGETIVYDGRKDGKEGLAGANASNEKSRGLNDQFIQDDTAFGTTGWDKDGVTKTSTPLFDGGGIFYVIPVDGDQMSVEIVYDVETIDPNLPTFLADGKTHGSSIENRISKDINFGTSSSLEAGKAYTINLHLGMNSVKFDAKVLDWDEMEPATDVDLPSNVPSFAFNSTNPAKFDIIGYKNADTSDEFITFVITGLKGGEQVSLSGCDGTIFSGVDSDTDNYIGSSSKTSELGNGSTGEGYGYANANGVAYVRVKISQKNLDIVNNVDGYIEINNSNSETMKINIRQLAVMLGLKEPADKTAAGVFDLRRQDAAGNDLTTVDWLAGTSTSEYKVWLNGSLLDNAIISADGKLTLHSSTTPVAGDIVKVTLKTGDVAEETISFTLE